VDVNSSAQMNCILNNATSTLPSSEISLKTSFTFIEFLHLSKCSEEHDSFVETSLTLLN